MTEEKQYTHSVIAKLMGLEELQPKLPIPCIKKRRVLSENYLQKTASIGSREKSSLFVGRSTRISTQKQQQFVNTFQRKSSKSAAKSKIQSYTDSFNCQQNVRPLPNYESGSTTASFGEFGIALMKKIDFHLEPEEKTRRTKIVVLRPGSERCHNTNNRRFSIRSHKELKPVNENSFRGSIWSKVSHSSKPIRRAVNVSKSLLNSEVLKLPSSSSFKSTRENGSPNSFGNRSFLAKEAKKQIMERWKLTDASQNVKVDHKGRTLREMLSMAEFETNAQHLGDGNTYTISVEQESMKETRSVYTKHPAVDPQKPREINQPSPNSVLEPPFKEEKLCTSELNDRHADLCSVAMQLELLDASSEETYSEGSEMAVSSDDDIERAIFENIKVLIDFNTEDSRDYSYLVDVLDEANLHDVNLREDYSIWTSSELPVDSSVFDMLEKKYGKQTSWPRSERKLLFDSINIGLSEVLHSFTDIYTMEKSLKRKCHQLTLGRNELEEELWKLLVSDKKEVCKDLSGKAVGNTKLQVEDEIGGICGEIERILFEELAAELACFEN